MKWLGKSHSNLWLTREFQWFFLSRLVKLRVKSVDAVFWNRSAQMDVLPQAISPDKPLAKATITSVKVRRLVKLLLWVFLQFFISNANKNKSSYLSMQQVPFRQLRRCGDVYISLSILALCEPGGMNMWWWALYLCLESCWVVRMLSKTMVDAIVALQCLRYVNQETHWSECRDMSWPPLPKKAQCNCRAVKIQLHGRWLKKKSGRRLMVAGEIGSWVE